MNTIDICQKILSNLIFTFSEVTPIFLQFLTAIILLAGSISFLMQILKTKIFLKNLNKRAIIPAALQPIIDSLKLTGKIDLIEDKRIFSFCFGIIRPRIALSSGLLKTLDKNELKAVLIHEKQHLLRYDPLKIVVSQTISSMFFFVPIFKDIQNYYLFSKEILADEAVIKNGNRLVLISVLSKLLKIKPLKFSAVATLANLDLEKRILYLSGKKIKDTFKPSVANIFISSLVVVFSLIIVNAPVYAVNTSEESSGNQTLFICPTEVNFSKDILYTPKDNHQ